MIMINRFIFSFFSALSFVFLILIRFTIQTINVTQISDRWTILLTIIAGDIGDGTQYSNCGVQYNISPISSSCPKTFEKNEIITIQNAVILVFTLLKAFFMCVIYQK